MAWTTGKPTFEFEWQDMQFRSGAEYADVDENVTYAVMFFPVGNCWYATRREGGWRAERHQFEEWFSTKEAGKQFCEAEYKQRQLASKGWKTA